MKAPGVRRLLEVALPVLGVGFLVALFARSLAEIGVSLATMDWRLLCLAGLLLLLLNGVMSGWFFERLVVRGFEGRFGETLVVFFVGQIAKYVPGKLWGLAYQAAAIKNPASPAMVVGANLDLTVLGIFVNLTSAVALLARSTPLAALATCVMGCVACVVLTGVDWLGPVFRRLRWLTAPAPTPAPPLRHVLRAAPYFFGALPLHVGCLYVLLAGALRLEPQAALDYVAYFGLAWTVGAVVFIIPAGIGIREGAFVLLAGLTPHGASPSLLAAIAIVLRLLQIAVDLAGAALAAAARLVNRPTAAEKA